MPDARRTGVTLVEPKRFELRCNACGERWRPDDRTGTTTERARCPNGCGRRLAHPDMIERLARVQKEKP